MKTSRRRGKTSAVFAAFMASSQTFLLVNGAYCETSPLALQPVGNVTVTAPPGTAKPTPQVVDARSIQGGGNITFPAGSATIIDFGNSASVYIAGNLTNNGTLLFASSNSQVNSASLTAAGVTNNAGATMSTVLNPTALMGLAGLYPISNMTINSGSDIVNHGVISSGGNLALNAVQNIVNTGTISSQANLAMAAASVSNSANITALQNINLQTANIVNSGQIAAALGNINIASNISNNIWINNSQGIIQAANGIINVRDALYQGVGKLEINGGAIIAKALNLNNGNGEIFGTLKSIDGRVNLRASCANLGVSEGELQLGSLTVSGDPTYFNDTGSIIIDGDIQVAESLAIIAYGDIVGTSNANLITTTSSLTGKGGNIYIIAGAKITAGKNSTAGVPPLTASASNLVSIAPNSFGAGGDIDFSQSPNLVISSASTCKGCNAGNILMAAYSNGTTGGHIYLQGPQAGFGSGSEINSSSQSGKAGNITIIAGASDNNYSQLGRITATGTSGSGQVSINSANPSSSNSSSLLSFNTKGTITTGNNLVPAKQLNNGDIILLDTIRAGGIKIATNGTFSANSDSEASLIADASGAGKKAGTIDVFAGNGIALYNGQVSASGTNGASGGNIDLRSNEFVNIYNYSVGGISATGSGGGNGGMVQLSSKDFIISATNANGSAIDVSTYPEKSSALGNGGSIKINSSNTDFQLTIGCPFCNSIGGNLLADGKNGGRIDINVAAGLNVDSATLSANGTTGKGGIIQVLGLPGETLNVDLHGATLTATNLADKTGVIGFNSFQVEGVQLHGCSCTTLHAGDTVALGLLNPSTAMPRIPLFFDRTAHFEHGTITADIGGPEMGNRIAIATTLTVPPTTPTTSTSTPPFPTLPTEPFTPVSFTETKTASVSGQNASLLPNTTIIGTDQTPESRQTTVRWIEDWRKVPQEEMPAALAYNADSQPLLEQGVKALAGPSADSMILNDGNVLFIAKEKVHVITEAGDVFINQGSIVFLMVTPTTTSAFNLHDAMLNSPIAMSGGKAVKFTVGREILLSKQGRPQFNTKIAFRQAEMLSRHNDGMEVHAAQFSLPSALNAIKPLKKMRNSDLPDLRKAIAQISKDAAIFSIVGNRFGAYQSTLPARSSSR